GVYHACGEFGICNINNRLICKCLPGFQPANPKNWDSGDFLDGCRRNSTSSDNSDMFLNLKMMKVGKPDSYFHEINETKCRKQCLAKSLCQAYSYEVAQNSTKRTPGIDNCRIWTSALSNLQEEYTNRACNLSVRLPKSIIESTVRNCEPCGSNLIPYPLSTGINCGDPIYFSFYCNTSSGQVSFKLPSGTYRVTKIDPSAQTFVIQVKYAGYDINSRGTQLLNVSLPFKRNYSSQVKDEIEISWDPPLQPSCNSSRDCKDWPNSTCNIKDGKNRCVCEQDFFWDGSNLNCTTKGNTPQGFKKPSKRKKRLLLCEMVPLIIGVFALTCSITFVYVWRRKKAKEEESRKSSRRNRVLRALDTEKHVKDLMDSGEFREEDEKGIDVPFFDLESIQVATNNFSDAKKLGKGGYGSVHKATFPGGQEIAVKRLSSVSKQGLQEFKNEVVLIAKLQHRNLVRLRGYCINGDEKILLYEYMPNKSLDSFIFDQKLSMSLDWEMRFKIILGIARGLVYLHHDSRLRIIHRDLKTSNILLDNEMNPKISDFGLAKMVEGKQTGANTTRVVGTHGYISPEYAQHGIFSIKSDVFSFGVVLLEIISGKKNTGFYESELAPSLLGYTWKLWVENKVLDLMDHTLREVCNADQFVKCVNIGLLCVQNDANDRPTMLNVVAMLDSEVGTISTPKRPAFVPGTDHSGAANSVRLETNTELTISLEGRLPPLSSSHIFQPPSPEYFSHIFDLASSFLGFCSRQPLITSRHRLLALSAGELRSGRQLISHLFFAHHQADDNKDGSLSLDEMLNHENIFYSTLPALHALFAMVSHRRKINCVLSASCSILFLYILLLCSCRVDYCYATDTLKQGEWISDNGTALVSSGGTFEMVFFPSNHKRFLGIRYERDRETYAWVANRDKPITNGSIEVSFGIAKDGNLQVWDITGKVYWSAKGVENSSSTNRTVKLMDSGNLVLTDTQLATSLWESFKNPTDTFLPGMKMDEKLRLISWTGDGDPGSGQFTFKQAAQEGEGHYVITSKKRGLDYWRSWMSGNFLSSDEMLITIVNLLSNFSSSASRPAIYGRDYNYTRLVMNQDGELQYLKWTVENGNWSLIWRKPEDHQCGIYNACGKFGSCNINNRPFVCKCLPGFQPTNPNNWDSGDFLDGCTRNLTSSNKSDMFLSLKMMKVSYPDSDFKVKNETECINECLDNSQCQAYSYEVAQNSSLRSETTAGTDTCWIWTSDVSNLQEEYTNGVNLSVRVAKSVIESTVKNCEPCGTNLIPYPLSTRPNCGDPMYFSFYCDNSIGKVSFKAISGTYRVATINATTQTFVIQVKYAGYGRDSRGTPLLNESLPFIETNSAITNSSSDVEISWNTPQQPRCTLAKDCNDWSNSICKKAEDGKMRCLCTGNWQWDDSSFNCTKAHVEGDFPRPSEQYSKGKKSLTLIVMIPLIVGFLLTSSIVCIYLWRRNMAKRQENTRSDGRNRVLRTLDSERHLQDLMGSGEFREEDEKGIDVPFFEFKSIQAATDNFSDVNKLGQGGYGPVYKGTFPDGQEIAVKRLSSISGQGLQEFKNEVVLIAKLQHRNLVRLRGYCIKGDEKILLYDYMPNKSLDSFIFDQKLSMRLDWEMRINIILGIARGLLYLHHDSRLRIIHRDLKTSNILLDKEMNPKISDFGLARIVGGNETEANTTRVVGTYGYMSPEYALDGLFSVKSDVFSFGVVLLEIITGKKNTGFYQSKQAMSLIG
ncbi:uncharacterized protein LOC132181681, partial [Corylus avellana]|uniref:uncharacterized protein LOC132181681 n=1 Tax=Corylus avellana TaxID=13451 RepID=UPI00286C4F71